MTTIIEKQRRLVRNTYGPNTLKNKWRRFTFLARAYWHKAHLQEIESFFATYMPYNKIGEEQLDMYTAVLRTVYYKNSTIVERKAIIKEHFRLLEEIFTESGIKSMYSIADRGIQIWSDSELDLQATLQFVPGQQKEGLLTLCLSERNKGIYHINFYVNKDCKGDLSIFVGTLQGYKDGLAKAKQITKKMYGYRPKNFIFFLLRQLALQMKVKHIYAISDEGFYTQSHAIRGNRSKSVVFNTFWSELGGTSSEDHPHYFTIPLTEIRKTYETAKTHKRNLYRNRYALLDGYMEQIVEKIQPCLR